MAKEFITDSDQIVLAVLKASKRTALAAKDVIDLAEITANILTPLYYFEKGCQGTRETMELVPWPRPYPRHEPKPEAEGQ